MSVHKNYIKIQQYRTELFKKHWKFQTFDEILYCGPNKFDLLKRITAKNENVGQTYL